MQLLDSRRAPIAGVAAIVTVLSAVNIYYFHRSQTPTFWDDSYYLVGSLQLYDALIDKGIPGFVSTFSHLYGSKPPLICVFPVPIYVIFGRDYDPRCLVGIGFLIVMSVYLFRLGSCLWSPREGLLAVAILQTMPLFYGLSRQFLVDYGLATMVVMWMYYLLCSRGFTATGTIVRLGILLGIGMLMKVSFPLFIAPPTIVAIWALLRADRDWRKALKTLGALGCIFIIGALVASPWYVRNLRSVVDFALALGLGKRFLSQGSTDIFSWSVISFYFHLLVVCALSCYYAILLAALLPAWIISIWRKRSKGTSHSLALLAWALPFAVTTFAVTKDPRYTSCMWPAVALFLARMIRVVFDRWRLYPAVAVGLMIVPTIAYASASLPVMARFGDFRLGRWIFWSPHLTWYASSPSNEGAWGQAEIIRDVCRDAQQAPPDARLFIPLAHQYLNNINLEYLTARLKCKVQVIGLPMPLQTPKEVADFIDAVKPVYVLVVPDVPEQLLAPEFANAMKVEAEKIVTRPDSGFQLLYRRSLGPTGKEILIYRRN